MSSQPLIGRLTLSEISDNHYLSYQSENVTRSIDRYLTEYHWARFDSCTPALPAFACQSRSYRIPRGVYTVQRLYSATSDTQSVNESRTRGIEPPKPTDADLTVTLVKMPSLRLSGSLSRFPVSRRLLYVLRLIFQTSPVTYPRLCRLTNRDSRTSSRAPALNTKRPTTCFVLAGFEDAVER